MNNVRSGLVLAVSLLAGCVVAPMRGPDGGLIATGGGAGGGTGGTGGDCCLNGSYYRCDTAAAFTACAGPDVGKCHSACGMTDFQCHINCDDQAAHASHDPSQCRRDSAKDGTCSASGSCLSGVNLPSCTYSTQCSSGNCTDGHCYGNANGQRCTYSTQCTSGNCTDGCCSGNSSGSACTYSTQCTSGNCSNGHCQ